MYNEKYKCKTCNTSIGKTMCDICRHEIHERDEQIDLQRYGGTMPNITIDICTIDCLIKYIKNNEEILLLDNNIRKVKILPTSLQKQAYMQGMTEDDITIIRIKSFIPLEVMLIKLEGNSTEFLIEKYHDILKKELKKDGQKYIDNTSYTTECMACKEPVVTERAIKGVVICDKCASNAKIKLEKNND